jgi:hypothetical protein
MEYDIKAGRAARGSMAKFRSPTRPLLMVATAVVLMLLMAASFQPYWPKNPRKHWDFLHLAGDETESVVRATASGDQYLLGVGKADITGYVLSITPF